MTAAAMHEGSNLFEWTHKRVDGTTFETEVLLTRMELNGQVYLHGALRDISVRKNLEKELLAQREEMETLVKRQVAIQTAAAIAHELNQPLLALASYSKAVLMMLHAGNPDLAKIRQAVEACERQSLRAGQAIRELLEFLSMNEFPTDAFDLNREILDVLDTAKSEHELQFQSVLHLKKGLPLVRANRTHIKKVLLNLLHNSIEAMQEAGVPLPSVTVIVRTKKDENIAQVTIQDNGPGFTPEDARRLFQPFFTTKTKGIGMGLVISRALIEANGGQLWVDPQEGPGAIFHMTLPLVT